MTEKGDRDQPDTGPQPQTSTSSKKRASRAWTDDEIARLKAHVAAGGSAARAAIIFKRSILAVKQIARREGCPFPHDLSVRRKLRDLARDD